jgi:hypothetical protein
MGIVDIGVQEGDRDGRDPLIPQGGGDRANGRFVQRDPDGAVDVDSLRDGETPASRNERHGLFDLEVVLVVAAFVGDLEDVAEAAGRHERRLRALALDQGVGGERGAMDEERQVREAQARFGQEGARSLDNGLLGRARRGQDLGGPPALTIFDDDVGERSTDIGGYPGADRTLSGSIECCPPPLLLPVPDLCPGNFFCMTPAQTKRRLGLLSLVVSAVLVAVKFYAYFLTRSQVVLTDALESIINVFTSGFALYSLYLAGCPKTKITPTATAKLSTCR